MDRRQFIGTTATTVAAAGLAGCGLLGGSSGPDGTVTSFYQALNNGNAEEARNLLHSDSPAADSLSGSLGSFEEADISVDSTEVVEQGDGRAVVEATITFEVTVSGETQSQSNTQRIELREENGNWRIWDEGGN